jgi:hypothetical protein
MATACLVLVMVVIHYFLDHQMSQNPVDRVVIDSVQTVLKAVFGDRSPPEKRWSDAIESTILAYSDLQVVTGIGILISGFTQLPQGLSIYHWETVVYLAWFSSLTHLTTLTVLRKFFRDQPRLAYWRVFLMGCNILLLGTGLGPVGYGVTFWQTHEFLATPAVCLFTNTGVIETSKSIDPHWAIWIALNPELWDILKVYPVIYEYAFRQYNWAYVMLSLLFLVITYISRVLSIFTRASNAAKKYLRTLPGNFWKTALFYSWKRSKDSTLVVFRYFWACVYINMLAIYVILRIYFEISLSMLWEVSYITNINPLVLVKMTNFTFLKIFCLLTALAWGAIRLITIRSKANLSGESTWGFGQVLAVLLLVLPFLSLSEQLFTKEAANEREADTMNTISYQRSTEFTEFLHNVKELEKGTWYRKLGLLMFALAILIAADLLYSFPSAAIAGGVAKPVGFGMLTFPLSIFKLYITWYIFIGGILFFYTIVFLIFTTQTRPWRCRSAVTRFKLGTGKIFPHVFGYIVILLLLSGAMCYNIVFRIHNFRSRQGAYVSLGSIPGVD